MRINHNIAALNTHRQLNSASTAQGKSMEKLSSGLRINRAGDDAAGLAISEKMRGQIRGLDQASKNSQDGISMIQTAEGALNETHDILQRMKELATQAANGTNTDTDRGEIQKEINQLTSEINRIGNTTEFNTQKLLDGGASTNGVNAGTTDGKGVAATFAKLEGNKAVDLTTVTFSSAGTTTLAVDVTNAAGSAQYTINEATMSVLWGDGTGKTKEDLANILSEYMVDGTGAKLGDVANVSIDSSGKLSITNKEAGAGNTVEITMASTDVATFGATLGFNATEAGGAANITVDGTDQTEATIAGSKTVAGTDSITASDWAGKSFTLEVNGTTVNATIAADFAGTDLDDLATEMTTQFGNALGTTATVTAAVTNGKFTFSTTTSATDIAAGDQPSLKISGDNLDEILGSVAAGTSEVGGTFTSKFQIGANQGQSFDVNVSDMRAQALGISGTTSNGNQGTVDGAKFTAIKGASNGTESTGTEYALDVSSFETASSAIKALDNAIQSVSAQRSQLGAFQNRLEHTINNLNTSSENLTAAESRIRDVDYALAA
jgi:flagellin